MKSHCSIISLCVALIFLATIRISTATELAERHHPLTPLPKIQFTPALSYEQYGHEIGSIIRARNPNASKLIGGAAGITVLDAVSPKQWPLSKDCIQPSKGILLIHGLSDSPYSIRDLGNSLSQNCVLVRSVLLPGHSTVPGDLVEVSYQDWIDASSWAIGSFSGKVEKLVVVGFSTGATLAIDFAIRNQNREGKFVPVLARDSVGGSSESVTQIVGLVLLSPAIAINAPMTFMARWVDALGVAFSERLRWASIAEDIDTTKYESFPMNAAAQIHILTKRLGSMLDMKHPVPVPVFVVASEQDTTIDTRETIQFFHNRTDSKSEMLLYASQNVQMGDKRIEVRSSANAAENILSQSHISIPIKPDNVHYGKQGDYVNCLHYSDNTELTICLDRNNSAIQLGEITDENKAIGTLRRISWNPDYEYMMDRINQFISEL